MFINKGEHLSRSSQPRRAGWGGGTRRRVPPNWFKIVRITLYGLIGLLAGIAALAAAALFLDGGVGLPPPTPPTPHQTADAAALPPVPATPLPVTPPPAAEALAAIPPAATTPAQTPAPAPAATPPPAPVASAPPASPPAAAAEQPDPRALAALQQQIRDANSTLSGLRAETEQIRRSLSDAARPHQAAPPPATAPAAGAVPRGAPANDQNGVSTAWADAERTIQALGQRAPTPTPAPTAGPPPVVPVPTRAPVPPAAPAAASSLASNAVPEPLPAAARPRVFLHFPAGSSGGLQEATDIAQRLLFSDFAYADTRSTTQPPTGSEIRYFFPEDAPAAQRLAALLADTGTYFHVQDATAHPGRARPGMLDVWVGR